MIHSAENPGLKEIVCFAGCDWWYHNRGLFVPQIMSRLAKRRKVVFVNSLGMRIPSLKGDTGAYQKIFRKLCSMIRYIRKADQQMYIFSPLSLPFRSERGRRFNRKGLQWQVDLLMKRLDIRKPILYLGCPPAWEIVKHKPRSFLIYEKTDLFYEMPGIDKPYIEKLDQELSSKADLVLYVNRALWAEGVQKNPNSLLIGHGVDYEKFACADNTPEIPEDMVSIPRPIVGFFGDVTEDVCDFSLIEYTARACPQVSFVFVGPLSSDVTSLKGLANIFFLGRKPYEQIPHYGKVFDVAMMPWRQNKWIQFCNPVKTKEYLALGKPIVSIDYPELSCYYDVVYRASTYEEFAALIRKAICEEDQTLVQRRKECVRQETWDNKAAQIEAFIEAHLNKAVNSEESHENFTRSVFENSGN